MSLLTIGIWLGVISIYLLFRLWYDGLSKPLQPDEVEKFLAEMEARSGRGLPEQDIEVYRRFMEEDDGKEFLMANVIKMEKSPVIHPDTGESIGARRLLFQYFRPFIKRISKAAGHPVISARVVGGYMDEKNMTDNPGWDVVGLVRYRSRRDAILATFTDPDFDSIHRYKVAALQKTFALPTHTMESLYLSPRISVALGLIIIGQAALLLLD